MALTIKALIKGSSISRQGGRQNYHVAGLDGMTPAIMWDALFAGGMPQPEEPHPVVPGVKVSNVEVTEMLGNFDCVVSVTYATDENQTPGGGGTSGTIEVDSSIVAVRTMIDASPLQGEPIRVIYNPGIAANPARANGLGVNVAGGDRGIGATVDKFVPMVTVRVMRVEEVAPLANANLFVGKVNSKDLFEPGDKEAYLCTRIGGTRNTDTTTKYNVTYEFQAPEDGWLKVAGYIEPTTGQLPEKNMGKITVNATRPRIRMAQDIFQDDSQNGLTIVRVQGLADMTALALPTL